MNPTLRISEERQSELWSLMSKHRKGMFNAFGPMIQRMKDDGINLDIPDLVYLLNQVSLNPLSVPLPPFLIEFLSLIAKDKGAKTFLAPSDQSGLLGACLYYLDQERLVDVVSPIPDAQDLLPWLALDNLSLQIRNDFEKMTFKRRFYDAILCFPPITVKRENRVYGTKPTTVSLYDTPSHLMVASLAQHLSDNGLMAVVLSPDFKRDERPSSLRQNLERFGIYLTAIISIRSGALTATCFAPDVAIFEKHSRNTLFVAEVPVEHNEQVELVERIFTRQEGASLRQGKLVDNTDFYSIEALETEASLCEVADYLGLTPIKFSDAIPNVRRNSSKTDNYERFVHVPNAVYLPESATSKATTKQESLPEKLKSYYQLIVDPTIVLPEYLAMFFNTPIGLTIRRVCMTGTIFPKTNLKYLKKQTLYFAPIEEQRLTIRAIDSISRMRMELSEHESLLWQKPNMVSKVIESIERINHDERFEDWIESLPFPLASILRSYHAIDNTDKEKCQRLLYFFEAFSEFLATIHLSAFKQDPILWNSTLATLIPQWHKYNIDLGRATFGCWKSIIELTTSKLRKAIADQNDLEAMLKLYATPQKDILEIISSKDLGAIIQKVNTLRNKWSGHGGAVSDKEAIERHDQLRTELDSLRGIVGTCFLDYQLVEAREVEIIRGPVYRTRLRKVMGSNPQFEQLTVTLLTTPYKHKLYLYSPSQKNALPLVPLINIRDEKQPAPFFYNRRETNCCRYVSYHFSDQSEIDEKDEDLIELLDEFRNHGQP